MWISSSVGIRAGWEVRDQAALSINPFTRFLQISTKIQEYIPDLSCSQVFRWSSKFFFCFYLLFSIIGTSLSCRYLVGDVLEVGIRNGAGFWSWWCSGEASGGLTVEEVGKYVMPGFVVISRVLKGIWGGTGSQRRCWMMDVLAAEFGTCCCFWKRM